MSKHRIMGLFSDFDQAFAANADISAHKIPGITVDDVTVKSPSEHPENEDVLGERPEHVPTSFLMGALFGITFGFSFLISALSSFLVQQQGGKAVVPLPSNFELTYE